jgi:hypothetical protein
MDLVGSRKNVFRWGPLDVECSVVDIDHGNGFIAFYEEIDVHTGAPIIGMVHLALPPGTI